MSRCDFSNYCHNQKILFPYDIIFFLKTMNAWFLVKSSCICTEVEFFGAILSGTFLCRHINLLSLNPSKVQWLSEKLSLWNKVENGEIHCGKWHGSVGSKQKQKHGSVMRCEQLGHAILRTLKIIGINDSNLVEMM